MSVRRKTTNRLTLYRTCHACGRLFRTTADHPFIRQIPADGKKQKTCYFCCESCWRASYAHPGWWDGLTDARRKAREAARDVLEKNRRYTPPTPKNCGSGRVSVTGATQKRPGRITDTRDRNGGCKVPEHILSLSYGKDSLACLGAIEKLGWPLDRIVHAEVWATDTIPADLPPMVKFKAKADKIIMDRWGIEVEHIRSARNYNDIFYMICGGNGRKAEKSKNVGNIYGWPFQRGPWCNSRLKQSVLQKIAKSEVQYIWVASDEPNRFHNLSDTKKSPLVEAGWTESMCRQWCEENGLLSPIYTTATRGGCWFCHNQGVGQLRLLRKNYPELWSLMLKWDKDSPVTFKADGHTVHDFDHRFRLEDEGLIYQDDKVFRWSMLEDELNFRLF